MSMETENLESKAEYHRARVDSTLEEIRDRLSVGQIVDEVWTKVRDGDGGDIVKTLGHQVRDNPLALGLIGAGVAWLLAGDSARATGRDLKRRYEDWRDDGDEGSYAQRPPYPNYRSEYSGSPNYRAGSSYGAGSTPQTGTGAKADTDKGTGITDKAKSAASQLSSTVSGAANRIGETASDTAKGAAEMARSAGDSIADAAGAAGESVQRYGAQVSDAARYAAEKAGRYGRYARRDLYVRGQRLRRTFLETLNEEPLIIGGVALAVGAAIGASLPRTKREDELLGRVSDDVREAAVSYGEEVVEQVGEVAQKAYEAASAEAEKKGLKPDSSKGEAVADKVAGNIADVAKAAADKAKDEAKKKGLT